MMMMMIKVIMIMILIIIMKTKYHQLLVALICYTDQSILLENF